MNFQLHLKGMALLTALAAIYPLPAFAAVVAGITQFSAGDVDLHHTDGKIDRLYKGSPVENGQAIVTGVNGRAQVKFSDGGLISLQPNTEFRISNYADQNSVNEDRFFVDLLRGSMRVVTGLIGKRNRDNYKLRTTSATIGIRGSGFNAAYYPDGTLGVTTEIDEIEVCTKNGCIGLTAGESVRVTNSTELPTRTFIRPTLPTPEPSQEAVVAGNQTTADGKPKVLSSAVAAAPVVQAPSPGAVPTPELPPGPAPAPIPQTNFTNSQVFAVGIEKKNESSNLFGTPGASTTFSGNRLVRVDNAGVSIWSDDTPAATVFQSLGNVSEAAFVGWGTWATGRKKEGNTTQLDNVHYIAGRATSLPEIQTLLSTPATFNYTHRGHTTPTRSDGALGTFTGATFAVQYFGGQSTYSINTRINTSWGDIGENFQSDQASFSGSYIQGTFIGPNAGFAGLTYSKDLGAGVVAGAVVFAK